MQNLSVELEGTSIQMDKEERTFRRLERQLTNGARMVEVPLGSSHPPERPHVPTRYDEISRDCAPATKAALITSKTAEVLQAMLSDHKAMRRTLKTKYEGHPWCSSGQDSQLPMPGAWVRYLVGVLPLRPGAAKYINT